MPPIELNHQLKKPIVLSSRKLIIALFILLILALVFFFFNKYQNLKKELIQTKAQIKAQEINIKTLNFTKLFIEKVLKAEGEIDFETRLQLENGVRALNDEEILSQWKKFVGSKTDEEAQNNVKDLLLMLVNKIEVIK